MKVLVLLVLISGTLFAQSEPDITPYIERLRSGEIDDVRDDIPDLLDEYPNSSGVQYLEGLVTEDGADAVRIFQGIVDDHPESEWADDALHKVYQFYYAIGLYRTAEIKWKQLTTDYPNSHYIAEASVAASDDTYEIPAGGDAVSQEQEPPSPEVPETAETAGDQVGQFALQVGAYGSRENAEKQKLFFEDQGFPVDVINRVKSSRSLFLVLVGNYLTYEEAKMKGADIRRAYNVDSFVVSR